MTSSVAKVGSCGIPSHSCELPDLLCPAEAAATMCGDGLVVTAGWTSRWTATWKVAGAEVVCPVRDLEAFPVSRGEPVRRFSWRQGQRHRPGLLFMVSTGRHHGFESLEEARLLLALDFAGGVSDVLVQPFRLRFGTVDGPVEHTPDVLAVTGDGIWVLDVRPWDLIGPQDRVKFAATAEMALACGWRYLLAAGWRPHVTATLDALSAQRRPLADPLGLRETLVGQVRAGPRSFGELAAATIAPPIARAQLLHLLWHRRLSIDLAWPLTDASVVRAPDRERLGGGG